MGMVIFKYQLDLVPEQIIKVGFPFKYLTMQWQRDRLCVWALCNENGSGSNRKIIMRGTGHSFEGAVKEDYIGTIQEGVFVWHFFDAGETERKPTPQTGGSCEGS